jgi:hypothetical protein
MAFIATKEVGEAAPELTGTARGAANACNSFKSASLNGNITVTQVLGLLSVMVDSIAKINSLKDTPGLEEYYKKAYDDPNYDVIPEFQTMITAMNDLASKITTDIPRSIAGYLDDRTLSAQGVLTDREFSTSAMSGVRAKIDAFLATVIV